MTPFRRPAAWLFAVGLFLTAQPARAAEADKYLPHDTDFVLIVNAKQIRSWPPFQEKVRGQLEKLLQTKEAGHVLDGTGFDPLKDLDRLVVAQAASSHYVKKTGNRTALGAGPSFALLEGRFDREKLLARAEQAAKDMPGKVELHKDGKVRLLEIHMDPDRSLYAALLDDHTLMLATVHSQAEEALERAAGKNKTGLKSKQMRELLAKAGDKRAVQWLADADMVTGISVSEHSENGKTVTNTKKVTLKQSGIEEFHGGITLEEAAFRVRFIVKATDKDTAEERAAKYEKSRKEGLAHLEAAAAKDKQWQPLVDALKSAHIRAERDSVLMEARGTAETAVQAVRAVFAFLRPRPAAGSEVSPKAKDFSKKGG